MIISGFKYDTEAAANAAIQTINNGEGIPVSPESTTQSYCQAYEHPDGYWYIIADDVTTKYLGAAIEITLPDPQLNF